MQLFKEANRMLDLLDKDYEVRDYLQTLQSKLGRR